MTGDQPWKGQEYERNYRNEFAHLIDRQVDLLELGIHEGGSLRWWRDFFPKGCIVGLDINSSDADADRIRTYQGGQQDTALLDRIASENAPDGFDIIIDDASHVADYTEQAFWHLFRNHLKPGGIYVIEDWATGYNPKWTDGRAYNPPANLVAHLQPAGQASAAPAKPGAGAIVRASIRNVARPVSRRLERVSPRLQARLRETYLRVDAVGHQQDYPSHSAGMVGFVKQLVDSTALNSIIRDGSNPRPEITHLRISAQHVFCYKRQD